MASGYTYCRCRDCFDVVVSDNDTTKPDFCNECKETGCEEDKECQRSDAYGVSELISDAAEAEEHFTLDELEAHASKQRGA